MTQTPVSDPLRAFDSLTKRQREVLALAAKGMTNPEIGEHLGISKDGAKWHIGEILTRLDVDTREEAVDLWRRYNGLPYRLHRIARAVFGPVAMRWVLGGVGVTAVAGLAVVLVVLAVGAGNDSQADATAATTTSPTATSPAAASPTALPSAVADGTPGYRTGNPDIDPVLAAIESGNPAKLIAVTQYMEIGCVVDPRQIGSPPPCPTGVANGTLLKVIPGSGGEGSYLPRAKYEADPVVPGVGLELYAIYRTPAGATRADNWPLGDYTIVYFDPSTNLTSSVAVTGGKIVNRFFLQPVSQVLRGVPANDVILAPRAG